MLKINNLSLIKDDKLILKDIFLEFEENKTYVITGPNGSGKSSFAKAIMGVFDLNDGDIYFDDVLLNDLKINERAKMGISLAFQTLPFFKGIVVNDLLEYGGDGEKKKLDVLRDFGLCPKKYLFREINDTLSGGELKRIELASVFMGTPKVLILDEPEAGIDIWSMDELTSLVKKFTKKEGLILIIISHQEKIIELADEVIVLEEGMVNSVLSPEEFLSSRTKCLLKETIYCEDEV